jgi:hypothetical protein
MHHRFVTVAVAGVICGSLFGTTGLTSAQTHNQAVNLSFVYPVSTNQTADLSASLRLSLLYGRLHSIKGLDLNVGASWLHHDFRGVQLTGLYSQIGGDFRGISLAFGPTYTKGMVKGGQLSFFPNVVMGSMSGLQYSWMFNFVAEDISGAQLSAIFNLSDAGGKGLQLAGVANALADPFQGAQIAGFNYSNTSVRGLQLGLANMASEIHGVQGGLINFAGEAHGVQVAALNLQHDNQGVPIGLFNHSETNGLVDGIVYGGSLSLANAGVRTTVNRFYSMLTVGFHDVTTGESDTIFLTWNWGYQAPLSPKWFLGFDLGFVHVIPEKSDDPNVDTESRPGLQARVVPEFRLSPKFAVFAGVGGSVLWSKYGSGATSEFEPLALLGVSLF